MSAPALHPPTHLPGTPRESRPRHARKRTLYSAWSDCIYSQTRRESAMIRNEKRRAYRLLERVLLSLTAVALLANPCLTMADYGPCEVYLDAFTNDTTACVAGSCIGNMQIGPLQKTCMGTNEAACTETPQRAYTQYPVKSTYLGTTTWLSCLSGTIGMTSACMACAAGAMTSCPNPATVWGCYAFVTACAYVCSTIPSPDPCCWISCGVDWTASPIAVAGGQTC